LGREAGVRLYRRQQAVYFSSPRLRIVVEVDGSRQAYQKEFDAVQMEYLRRRGYYVMRLLNKEPNLEGVLQLISGKMLTLF
jgi:very-short-patch-repair endonuclease